jgi:ACS family tartrate transporter-like MFS transporter
MLAGPQAGMIADNKVFAKCAWRLLPLVMTAYVVNYLDRTNLGFAALTMNQDLGFSPSVYGLGAGIFFFSYSLFQVPANLVLGKVGARRGICLILLAWGAAAMAGALISDPFTFYTIRFLLGVAEAGFFPGMIVYLTLWFPNAYLGRATSLFMAAASVSLILGGPLATLLLRLDGVAGFHGWQWLFLIEGIPACLLGAAVFGWLPSGPADARWLSEEERKVITGRIQTENKGKDVAALGALLDPRVLLLGVAYSGIFFAIAGLNFWLPLVVQGMGFSNTLNGFIVALVYLVDVPVMIFWGRSSDRRGERIWHVVLAILLAAVSFGLASVTENDGLLLLALTAAGIGVTSVLGPFFSLPSLFLSGQAMAGGFALVSSIGTLVGGFAGLYLIGAIREATGGYPAVLATIAAALIASSIIVLALGRVAAPRTQAVLAPQATDG